LAIYEGAGLFLRAPRAKKAEPRSTSTYIFSSPKGEENI